MSITTAVCNTFKKEALEGVHEASDTYKIALIKTSPAGTFGKATTNYSDLGADEASGTGYSAGGATLAGYATGLSGDTAYIDWNDATWATASISADGALIYNATQGNKAVQVINFADTGSVPVTSTAGTFTVTIPSSGTGQIRLT